MSKAPVSTSVDEASAASRVRSRVSYKGVTALRYESKCVGGGGFGSEGAGPRGGSGLRVERRGFAFFVG